jgi:hypothetical protein
MHDARVYANSELGQTLRDKLAGTDYHLIADLAYPLSSYLLKSYPREGATEVNIALQSMLQNHPLIRLCFPGTTVVQPHAKW